MSHKKIISWEEAEKQTRELGRSIARQYPKKFQYILALTRGGLIPSYLIADELGIKKIKTLCLSSYTDDHKRDTVEYLKIEGFCEEISDTSQWLVVDEICDSGKTLDFVEEKYPGIATACVYIKDHRECTFYHTKVDNDTWIVFPWESE